MARRVQTEVPNMQDEDDLINMGYAGAGPAIDDDDQAYDINALSDDEDPYGVELDEQDGGNQAVADHQ